MLPEYRRECRTNHLTAVMLPLFFFLALTTVAVSAAGSIDQLIINGEIATPHEFPSQLSLQTNNYHICGAVLIDKSHAITAAHCLNEGQTYTVKCGAHNIRQPEHRRQALPVQSFVIHPGYNTNNQAAFPNDIAVLRLAKPAKETYECFPATLPEKEQDFGNYPAIISGWGHTGSVYPGHLKRGDVTILTDDECYRRWGSYVNSDFHVCVKDLGNMVYGACFGDSGGPVHSYGFVVGLASFGSDNCLTSSPSVYVNLRQYRDWISNNTRV